LLTSPATASAPDTLPIGNGHLDAGMHVIAKPFNMTEFANKVREMIED